MKGHRGTVMLLGNYAPSLVRFRGRLIRQLVAKGYHVVACAPHQDGVAKDVGELGAEFLSIGPARTSVNPLSDLKYLLALVQLFRERRPIAALGYTAKPAIWGSIAARMCGINIRVGLITGLGSVFIDAETNSSILIRAIRLLYRFGLRGCTAIFENEDDRREFIDGGLVSEKQAVVVNGVGVDLAYFGAAPPASEPVFLMIARLLRHKGVIEYIEAAKVLKRKWPEARFQLVGWYDENPSALRPSDIEPWVQEGVVEFLGRREDVRPALKAARVYVLPSYREGTSVTILEAMAMGRPIVTTDVPGCRQPVTNGRNGFLVQPRDADALAEAMSRFLSDDGLAERMGRESRRIAEGYYSDIDVAESVIRAAGL